MDSIKYIIYYIILIKIINQYLYTCTMYYLIKQNWKYIEECICQTGNLVFRISNLIIYFII